MKSVRNGRKSCVINNYLHSPIAAISESAQSASCLCRFIRKRLCFYNTAEQGLEERCPFCRHPIQKSKAAEFGLLMKRVEKNDPSALLYMGKAFEYWTKAAALGNAQAHHYLATMYTWGDGVEKDKKKEVYHLEQAAIGGHPIARNKLGYSEWENGRYERAVKHFIIASNLEHHESLRALMKLYALGKASKDDYAKALRAYQAAVEATKSPQRKEAERYQRG
jgi:TPR repeat protein